MKIIAGLRDLLTNIRDIIQLWIGVTVTITVALLVIGLTYLFFTPVGWIILIILAIKGCS